jgi:solute carrier family 25 protein 34/35
MPQQQQESAELVSPTSSDDKSRGQPAAAAGKVTFSTPVGIAHGAMAGCGAAVFSNPFEVVKIRLQLQGELQSRASTQVLYKGLWHGLYTIGRVEGIRGLQKGLLSAFVYQTILNGTRLGMYEPVKKQTMALLKPDKKENTNNNNFLHAVASVLVSLIPGFLVGFAASLAANPFFLLKTRLQSEASSSGLAVGTQHHYNGIRDGLTQIWVKENGLKGLFHGAYFGSIRTGAGSSVQLASYDFLKMRIAEAFHFSPNDFLLHLLSSAMSSFVVMVCMNPFDVVMTRVYNAKAASKQSAGAQVVAAGQYGGFLSAFRTITQVEGIAGLYKGSMALWARIGPHTIMTFVLLEQLRQFSHRQGWSEECKAMLANES